MYSLAMSPDDIAKYRLLNQQIAIAASKTPGEVVASLGAMQAQDYAGALWAIGLRLPGTTEAVIQHAIAERQIVRTWPMRGTLHFVPAADVHWMLVLLTPRVIAGTARRQQQLELDSSIFARCGELFVSALQGGKQLTRDEMYEVLERSGISTGKQRGYHILWRLSQERLLCFAAHAGKQPTFALLDEWIPEAKILARDEALARLTLRYFTSHGPATVQDYVWWSGLTAADAKAGIEMVSSRLAKEKLDGKTYWMRLDMPDLPDDTPTLHILPGFDEYLIGYKDRSASLEPAHAQKVVPGNNGMFMPTIVNGGRVVGIWKRDLKKKAVVIAPQAFTSLNKAEKEGFQRAAEQYGRFLSLPVEFLHEAKNGELLARRTRSSGKDT